MSAAGSNCFTRAPGRAQSGRGREQTGHLLLLPLPSVLCARVREEQGFGTLDPLSDLPTDRLTCQMISHGIRKRVSCHGTLLYSIFFGTLAFLSAVGRNPLVEEFLVVMSAFSPHCGGAVATSQAPSDSFAPVKSE